MRTIIKGKNIQVSDEIRKRLEEKLDKISRHQHLVNIKEIEVEFSVENNPSIEKDKAVEITAFTKGPVIRAKESSADMLSSIDLVIDKLDRQIEKYKGKVYRSQNHKGRHEALELKQQSAVKVVREKEFSMEPMTIQEAILQMELLEHGFFIFRNADTSQINVLYARKDGGLGLMKPE